MRIWYGLFLLFLAPTPVISQVEVEFCGVSWIVRGEVRTGQKLGREALLIRSGLAILSGVEFENGTIEYDVAVSGERSFLGVAFRFDTTAGTYEDFYLRPHQTGRPDATQYTPVYHGVSAWQLYPEYNTSLNIPRDEWIHIRLEIAGSRMEVYVNSMDEPLIVIDRLRLGRTQGAVALKAILGANTDAYPSAFSNFSIVNNDRPVHYTDEPTPTLESGYVQQWAVSDAYTANPSHLKELPHDLLSSSTWRVVNSDSIGRVNLAKLHPFPSGGGLIFARVIIDANRSLVKQLNFGFSDRGSVFLNGELLFTGDNTYLSRSHRYLGVMTVDNDALFLPLEHGENELVFAVSEAFGGWGLTARFENMDGIRLDTRTR